MNDFNLPKIPEDLDKEEFEYRNKYRNIYIKLIIRCQNMTDQELSGYNEKHHILPKCLGGSNDIENLVIMPVRYHIMAHILLTKVYPDNQRLYYAMLLITETTGKKIQENRVQYGIKFFSTRYIADLRTAAWDKLRELGKDEEHRRKISESLKGKPLAEETKRKLSEKLSGRKVSEETRRKLSNNMKGRPKSLEHRKNMSLVRIGKKLSEETRHKMSISTSGERNPIFGTKRSEETKKKISEKNFGGRNGKARKVVDPLGRVFDCVADAAREYGVTRTSICWWASGKVKSRTGWKYYTEDNNSQSD